MTSATEVLRRLLDERGVEYETYIEQPTGFEHVKWNFNEHGSADFNLEFGEPWLTMYGVISGPEQAIAATLGSCNCSDNCTNSERTETCHITRQFTCSECGYQYPTRNYETYETCDGRTAYAPLGHYVLDWKKPNYCPNCGRRIEQ